MRSFQQVTPRGSGRRERSRRVSTWLTRRTCCVKLTKSNLWKCVRLITIQSLKHWLHSVWQSSMSHQRNAVQRVGSRVNPRDIPVLLKNDLIWLATCCLLAALTVNAIRPINTDKPPILVVTKCIITILSIRKVPLADCYVVTVSLLSKVAEVYDFTKTSALSARQSAMVGTQCLPPAAIIRNALVGKEIKSLWYSVFPSLLLGLLIFFLRSKVVNFSDVAENHASLISSFNFMFGELHKNVSGEA